MYVSNQIIYLQMQKTGSTHITGVLRRYTRGKAQLKHAQLVDYHAVKDRLIVSSIRNPWDWYVSLWAYGCSGKGGLQKYLTGGTLNEFRHAVRWRSVPASMQAAMRLITRAGRRHDWAALYADPTDVENFRLWLQLILGAEGQFLAKEGYSASQVKSTIGLMTYRFLSLVTEYHRWNASGRKARSFQEIADFADRHRIASRIMRMETLNEDLLEVLQLLGVRVTLEELDSISKTNASSHRIYSDYYDDDCYQLVARRDQLIVERFGYQRL